MRNTTKKIIKPYTKKALPWLIPVVGVLITSAFLVGNEIVEFNAVFRHLIYGVLMTGGIWIGCLKIVTYLWERCPWEHQPQKHLVVEFLAILVYTMLYSYSLYSLCVQTGFIESRPDKLLAEVFVTILITFFITTLHESVFFYQQWKYNFSKSIQLQNKHLRAQYEVLKAQVSPHYIFNSLNNLVSIVDENPLAVEYINQMSSYLRYVLKNRREELVVLKEELSMLKKYIYLHKIRYGEIFNVKINVDDDLLQMQLPPLTLQMLLENVIKHNVIAKAKPLYVHIYHSNGYLLMENNRNLKKVMDSTGQGLNNIKQRYSYFTSNKVVVEETYAIFKVAVPLLGGL
jgi:hypothetical protein